MSELTKEHFDEQIALLPNKSEFRALQEDVKDTKVSIQELKKDNNAYAKDIVRLDTAVVSIQKQLKLKSIG